MSKVTKYSSSFVPSAVAFLLIGVAAGSAFTVSALRGGFGKQAVVRASSNAGYPAGETRSASVSLAQVEGMSEDAENMLVKRSDFYWHHGDYPRIIGLDRVITEVDPEDVETYSTGGYLMESLGDNADAQAYYALGMARNPSSSYAAFSLAMFYVHTVHQYGLAEGVLTKSVHDADAGVLDWKLLAHTYENENKYDNAVATWKYIRDKYPTAPAIQTNLSRDEAVLSGSVSTPNSAGADSAPHAAADTAIRPSSAAVSDNA